MTCIYLLYKNAPIRKALPSLRCWEAQFFLFQTISIFPQQINVLTQYIDGSMVYGSDSMIEARLRAFKGVLMDTQAYSVDYGHDEILPDNPETFCLPNGTNE